MILILPCCQVKKLGTTESAANHQLITSVKWLKANKSSFKKLKLI